MAELSIQGLRCMFCATRVKAAIRKFDPRISAQVDWRAGRVTVPDSADLSVVQHALDYLDELTQAALREPVPSTGP